MKKFYFLFLFALIASIGNLYAAEKTVTTTFTDNDLAVGAGEPEWESSIAATAFETSGSKRGVQFGAAKGIFTLKTKVPFSKVKNVSVLLSSNGNGNTVSLKVGVASVGKKVSIVKKNNYSVEWTAESPQDGIVELSFNDAAKSIYIKSISITYEEAAETKCAQPTFNLTADATYTDVQDLVITSTTEGAQIEYTITGDKLAAPITGKQASPATVHLTANDLYMVTATATKEGLDASGPAELMFTIAKKMNKPTFNLTEGVVYGEAQVLEITSDKVGAQIEYTVVGGNISITKTEASPVSVTLDLNGEYTVEAFALEMDDYAKSDAAGLNFRIELAAGVPTFSVEEGTYPEAQTIALAPGEGGEKVFYTINDGTEQQYIEPIKLEEEGIYKIAAYTAGTETLAKSATVTKTYVINLPLEEPYILCTDAAWLTEGAKVIFVGKNSTDNTTFGMASQVTTGKKSYRGHGVVTLSEDGNFLNNKDAEVRVFSVERSGDKMAFKDVEGYLYNDNTENAIKTGETITENCYWTVSIGTDDVASVVSSTNTVYRNIKYNAQADRFAAYNDKYEGEVYIYLLGSTSSVSSMSAEGVKVFAAEGGVEVVADEAAEVAVYTVAGQLVRQARVAEGSTLVNVAPGFYVVRANDTATKVIVR